MPVLDPMWLDIGFGALSLVYHSFLAVFFTIVYVVMTILQYVPTVLKYVSSTTQFLALPFGALWRVFLFVFAPVKYTVRLLFSPFLMLLRNIQRLAPLYTYFATAIVIGILTGLLLLIVTSMTFSLFRLWDTTKDSIIPKPATPISHPPSTTPTNNPATTDSSSKPPASPSIRGGSDDYDTLSTDLDALFAGISSSAESDHYLLAALQGSGSGWRDPANTKRKRRSGGGGGGGGLSGLTGRFGTILEEDDDSL